MSAARLRRPVLALAAALVGVLAVSGCVSVPTSGSVRTVDEAPSTEGALLKTPADPLLGARPDQVVTGFLEAMEAFPISTAVAARYLTAAAAQSWRPDRGTVVYESQTSDLLPAGASGERRVQTDIGAVARLSSRGTYQPVPESEARTRLQFKLDRVDGEWRITNPPDATYIRSFFFESYYQTFDLFFLREGQQTLVADPVFLPIGEQQATQLVRGVLAGPTPWLGRQATTQVPDPAQVQVSVPVREDGTAEVQLSDAELSDDDLRLLSAQLAWTLRQVPGLDGLRLTVDGAVVAAPGAGDVQPVSSFADLDPSGPPTRAQLYALTEGGALTVVGSEEERLPGTWGARSRRLADFGIDRGLVRVAGVPTARRRLLVGPLGAADGAELEEWYATAGTLHDPQWDAAGQLWALDRAADSTSWVVGSAAEDTAEVEAGRLERPGVRAMAVSADGARVAAVVDRWSGPVWGGGNIDGPAVVVARVRRDPDGRVLRLDQAYAIPTPQSSLESLRDVVWSGPSLVSVLGAVTGSGLQPYQLSIDGSALVGGVLSIDPRLPGTGRSLAAADVGGAVTAVAIEGGRMVALGSDNQWATIGDGLRDPHYPG